LLLVRVLQLDDLMTLAVALLLCVLDALVTFDQILLLAVERGRVLWPLRCALASTGGGAPKEVLRAQCTRIVSGPQIQIIPWLVLEIERRLRLILPLLSATTCILELDLTGDAELSTLRTLA
jgi:hypothetical protein